MTIVQRDADAPEVADGKALGALFVEVLLRSAVPAIGGATVGRIAVNTLVDRGSGGATLYWSHPPPPAPHALRQYLPDFETLDYTLTIDAFTGELIDQLFSGLVELTPDLELAPDLVHRWEVFENGRLCNPASRGGGLRRCVEPT